MSESRFLQSVIRVSLIVLAVFTASCLSSGGGGSDAGSVGTGTVSASQCASVKYAAPSGPANDIIFTFDKAYTCGQFANGDWWVSTDGSGNLTITSITPALSAGQNGYEVNPSSTTTQSFDSRIPLVTYVAPTALPTNWGGISSVVKAVSIPNPAAPPVLNKTFLQYAAVLTILNAPLASSTQYFRPNYFGNSSTKKIYSINDLKIADFLTRSQYVPDATTLAQAAAYPISGIATRYQQVQLDHIEEFVGDQIHPLDNMPDYGADMATDNSSSLLRMLLNDFNYSNPTHQRAMINFLQMAVDWRALAKGGRTWSPNGGHGQGRKLPLVFAKYILNDADFTDAITTSSFSEDTQVYQGKTQPLFGRFRGAPGLFPAPPPPPLPPVGQRGTLDFAYWEYLVDFPNGGKEIRDPYGYVDGGTWDIGGLYAFCCSAMPWKYTTMAIRMLNLRNEWRSNVGGADYFMQYVDRWTTVGTVGGATPPTGTVPPDDPCTPYPHAKGSGNWTGYGTTWGPDLANPGECIKGGGPRFPGKHNINANDGNRKNSFSEALFNWCRPNTLCN